MIPQALDPYLDAIAAICLLLGAFLSLAAGVGLLRFPDALSRLHAATKPQILGLVFIVTAIALTARSWTTLLALIPVLLFQMLTAPIAAHMVGRAAYRTGNFLGELSLVDDLEEAVNRASAESAEADGSTADAEREPGRG
ncbi:MAG: monovalent cation/H(+) antiporter subunit G [Burkholderiaceae bacterium]|nr:monovalent cation/H(+) antiporter subunit G [Microbacteriaceae bacterium]